jgi:hypothetical protein
MIHTCKSFQGLRKTRRIARGELDIHIGSGAKVTAIEVSTYHLSLPSGLVLELYNCYCIFALSKNIISSLYLEEVDGYEIIIKNNYCLIYYNGIFYVNFPLVNELYSLDLEDKFVCNINVYNGSTKRFESAFIWHCHLGHLLSSFDFESIDICDRCLLGKVTKAPFTGQSERASDL